MGLWQGRAEKKASGGRYWPARKKRAFEIGSDAVYTKLSEKTDSRTKKRRSFRKTTKTTTLLTASHANLNTDGKFQKVKIRTVVENPANRHFVRMNVITKGAVIKTDAGLAKITSKPTRDGMVNAVLIKAK